MQCSVYKSLSKKDYFLFVPSAEAFTRVPAGLARLLGRLEKVMDLDLHAGRRLAQAQARDVLAQLEAQGYYLQMPLDVAGATPAS